MSQDSKKSTPSKQADDENPQEFERKLLEAHPSVDNKPPSMIGIPLTPTVKAIKTREELTNVPPRREEAGPYNVGDLLWVKLPGYPHWPAMISRDPVDGRYARSSSNGFTYHIQYFGEPTRNWIHTGKFWPFEGPLLYLPNSKKTVIPKSRSKRYEEAIAEAIRASKLEPQVRVKKLTFNYILIDPKANNSPKTPASAKKKRVTTKARSSGKSTNGSVYDFDETIEDVEQDDNLELVWSRPREPTPPSFKEEEQEPSPEPSIRSPEPIRTSPEPDDEQVEEEEEVKEEEPPAPVKSIPRIKGGRELRERHVTTKTALTPATKTPVSKNTDKKTNSKTTSKSTSTPKVKLSSTTKVDSNKNSGSKNDADDINESSRPTKRLRGASEVVKKPEQPATDALTSSEDASSNSDMETPTDVRLDKLCNVCHEETGTFYFCSGTCLRTMHAACGGSDSSSFTNKSDTKFICQECKTGKHPCFVCHETTTPAKGDADDNHNGDNRENDVIKCCHKNCGKYYHLSCLDPQCYPTNIRSDKRTFTCPMHFCLSCYTDQPNPKEIDCLKPSKRQLIKCLSCPTAFHNDDDCTAAGTVFMAGSYVLCPAHRNTKPKDHINVGWCFSCSEGGDLICCESCPVAFHAECIDNPPQAEDEQYFCYDCSGRKQLHYGDIIWIKLGAYRWWPAKICQPSAVPENIMKLDHSHGDFPVYFFGSHDYYWSHKARVFKFVEEDGHLKSGKSSSSDKKFRQALEEARAEYAQRKVKDDERLVKLKNTEKPRFRLIKQNKPIGSVKESTYDDLQICAKQRCDCKPDGEVLCGTDDCLNRLMMLECEPGNCPVGDKCKNQRFRKRLYPVCVPFRTDSVGWGLKTAQDIKKGEFVIEYVGELIDEAECNKRMRDKIDKGDTTFYFLTIDKERIIDAEPAANHARFMNHSCQPNCETQKWVVMGQTKVGLFANQDIRAGSELTFNYNLDCRGNEMMQCRCKSENCSGFIGLPVKNAKKYNNTNGTNNNSNHTNNNNNYQTNINHINQNGHSNHNSHH